MGALFWGHTVDQWASFVFAVVTAGAAALAIVALAALWVLAAMRAL